ncbi:MAG: hypothetical protein Q7T76_21850 [Ferruginibacter sp.]|nr:hypothetical protein [Ferruginibacter sp.]
MVKQLYVIFLKKLALDSFVKGSKPVQKDITVSCTFWWNSLS